MGEELVTQAVELPGGELRILQPAESAALPDDGGVEWAPLVPYWSVIWRSGMALARDLDRPHLAGRRVVELGCGLGLPSIAAARAGAKVLATDADPAALGLVARNAEENGVMLETAVADWADPGDLVERAPFDLALASDVLYERQSVAPLLRLLPRLAPEAWVADPGRQAADAFLEQARRRWRVETAGRGVVSIHRLGFRRRPIIRRAASRSVLEFASTLQVGRDVLWSIHRNRRKLVMVALAALVVGAVAILVLRPRLASGGAKHTAAAKLAAAPLAPEPWAKDPTYKPGGSNNTAAVWEQKPPKAAPAPVDPKTGMPAASAGTNGSFTPPSPAERRRIFTATHPVGGVDSALLLDRTALAPPDAPDVVKAMISAANLIVGQPYVWGGGHASFQSKGYDCSGAVSYALAGGGLLQAPLTSSGFMSYGAPGPGRWLTIYANSGHVYAVIAGLRWDTVGDARGSGPRWHPLDAYPQGFVARHIPGL